MRPNHAYASLVPTATPNRTPTTSPPSLVSKSEHIGLRTCVRTPRLQPSSFCPHWNGSPSPRSSPHQTNVRSTLSQSVRPWNILRTLLMLEILDNSNTSNKNIWSCFLQAQVHYEPHHNSRRQSYRSGRSTCTRAPQSDAPPHAGTHYTSSSRPTKRLPTSRNQLQLGSINARHP